MASREEKKKQRRQKRLRKREQRPAQGQALAGLRELERALKVPPPATFPGSRDPSLARPDLVKYELAVSATDQEPGGSRLRRMKDAARLGLLGDLPELADHWVTEEFLWHGVPDDPWHPVDAFLAGAGDRFPPAAADQIRSWKAAEIGLYEIGEVHDDIFTLRDWDLIRKTHSGLPKQAISLSIGGVNAYSKSAGALMVTYLAPWSPAESLHCAMGYGKIMPKHDADMLIPLLGLRHPEVVCRPLPWKLNRAAADEHLREWRQREWHGWLGERLRFPFWALVGTPPDGKPELREVTELVPSTPQQAHQFGIYLLAPRGEVALAVGGTMLEPIDVTSPTTIAMAEYQAFRARVGPPPGTRGMPSFTEVR